MILHRKRAPRIGVEIFPEIREFENFTESEILGCTHLWISLSRARFDEKSNFEVSSAVSLQEPYRIAEKQNLELKVSRIFFGRCKTKHRDSSEPFWQSFVLIRAMFEELRKVFTRSPQERSYFHSVISFLQKNCFCLS